MVTITIKKGAKTIYLQGDGKSFVVDDSSRKEALLTPLPAYLNDSDQTDVFDFGGVIKTLTLNGYFVGSDLSEVRSFINDLEGLVQGHQDSVAGYPLTFFNEARHGSVSNAIKVKVMDVSTNLLGGDPLRVSWSLKLVQAREGV